MIKILAFDLATKTGWACGTASPAGAAVTGFGTKELPRTGDDIGRFAVAFDFWLADMLTIERPDVVVFEAPIHTGGKTSHETSRKLGGLAYHVELVCGLREFVCREANLMTVKKFFGRSGRADKAEMMRRAYELGWRVKDDNQADALAVWAWYVSIRYPNVGRQFAARPGLQLEAAQ